MCSDVQQPRVGKENALNWVTSLNLSPFSAGGLTGFPGALAASPAMVAPRHGNVGRLWNRQEKAWLLVRHETSHFGSLESEKLFGRKGVRGEQH